MQRSIDICVQDILFSIGWDYGERDGKTQQPGELVRLKIHWSLRSINLPLGMDPSISFSRSR